MADRSAYLGELHCLERNGGRARHRQRRVHLGHRLAHGARAAADGEAHRPVPGAILVMYFASEPVAAFIERHPTTKMLALSFLLLIGAALIADGFHFHIPRGYIYFAMAFSAAVEAINVIALRNRRKPKAARE